MSCRKQVGFLMHNGNKDHQNSILTKDCKTLKDIRKKKKIVDLEFDWIVGLVRLWVYVWRSRLVRD